MTKEQFFAQREQAMWKKLSSELRWTEEMLIKYANKVDWNDVSSNEKVVWTESLIRKFTDKLDWKELSKNNAPTLVRPELVRIFALNWHWDEKTSHIDWTPEFVEEMKEYLDWKEMFTAASCEEQEHFLNKYFDYISRTKFNEYNWNRFPHFKKYVDEHWVERASEIMRYVTL